MTTLRPRTVADLTDLLRGRPGKLRIRGSGSQQERLPPAPAGAQELDCSGLDAIERLDAPDQTCTVGAGVPRAALDEALRPHRLELPCLGGGTLGGLFASDAIGPASVGAASPRTLLLGMEAMLADGTSFQSGARVVKSVAGFDVHKLLVGSRGTLFCATRLHLRLKPMPRASVWFCADQLDLAPALERFVALRSLAVPPAQLHLQRTAAGIRLTGRIAGRGTFVNATLRSHGLTEAPAPSQLHLAAPAGGEVLSGVVLPSRVGELLAAAPTDAAFLLHGGGRFELALANPVATDRVLASLPHLGAHACIVAGDSARRGNGTPLDLGQQRLAAGLKQALDPHGIFV